MPRDQQALSDLRHSHVAGYVDSQCSKWTLVFSGYRRGHSHHQFVVAFGGAQGPADRFRRVDRVGGISTYVSYRGFSGIIAWQNLAVGSGLRYSGGCDVVPFRCKSFPPRVTGSSGTRRWSWRKNILHHGEVQPGADFNAASR